MRKALNALLNACFNAGGTVEEAVEVMAEKVKSLRRKYADRQPWAHAFYMEGDYLIGLGRAIIGPQLQFERKECDRLRRTLKTGAAAAEIPDGGK